MRIMLETMRQQLARWYLEYVNDFITVKGFAEYYGLSVEQARILIVVGRAIHEENVKENRE